MASAIIHMAVAHEINKVIKHDNDKLLIGSIAPDISKQIGESKVKSHFLDNNDTNIPNMDKFLKKYKHRLDDDFVLGYYIHLYTDYLWFKYFITEIHEKDMVTKLDGSIVKVDKDMYIKYIYNDYSNLNIQLLDEYNMDLHIFYRDLPKIENIIEEIPMNKLQIIIDQSALVIQNSKVKKEYVFNIENIKIFIKTSVELILSKLEELGIKIKA